MKTLGSSSFARAAMLGLLAATQPACTDADTSSGDGDGDGSGGAKTDQGKGGSGGDDQNPGSGASNQGSGSAQGTGSTGSTGEGGAGAAGGQGGGAPVEGVLSTEIIPDLTLEDFTEMCDEAGGVVETHAVCGGVVSGPGFSYDDDTHAFTEHTCAGYNTCSGFSCVIDD